MKIAITGASGFIGRRLVQTFSGHSLTLLSRNPREGPRPGIATARWDPLAGPPEASALDGAGAVIHLAGEPVAQRWTHEAKLRIRESRAIGTRNLVLGLKGLAHPPSVLVSASAIGYYGSRGDDVLDESDVPGTGFLSAVTMEWEREAAAACAFGVRVVHLRIGIVLDSAGGALESMLPPFRMGLGGPLASGQQWMSWIHLEDLARMFQHTVETPIDGPVNGTAPFPVTNAEFTRALAKALHRPAIFPIPAFVLRAVFGEMSEVLLASQRVLPRVAEATGFRFTYPVLDRAMADLFTRTR